jgi:TonB family protein
MKAFFFLLLVLPISLIAQDWKVISVGDNSNYYIRKHSENPGDTKVWIKEEGPKVEYTNSGGKKMLIRGKHIVLWDINCSDKQIALLSSTIYNSAGTVLNNTVIPSYSIEFQDVIPESKGELWLNEACNLFNPEEIISEEVEEDEFIEADSIAVEELVEYVEPEYEEQTIIEEDPQTEVEIVEPILNESEEEEEEEELVVIEAKDEIYTTVQQQAEFPGGIKAWSRFLSAMIRYPAAAKRANRGGTVLVSFVINTNGTIQDIQLKKRIGFGCDEEAIRVIKAMPRWNPAKQDGKAVRSRFTQPITFAITK